MLNQLLKVKPWPLFVLLAGLLSISLFLIIAQVFSSIDFSNPKPIDPDVLAIKGFYQRPLSAIYNLIALAWMYAVGVELQKKISPELQTDAKIFKIVVIATAAYYIVFSVLLPLTMTNVTPEFVSILIKIRTPFYLATFYCYYFVAKVYKTILLQRKVSIGEHIGEFFLVMFLPIGVLMFQSKINSVAKGEDAASLK